MTLNLNSRMLTNKVRNVVIPTLVCICCYHAVREVSAARIWKVGFVKGKYMPIVCQRFYQGPKKTRSYSKTSGYIRNDKIILQIEQSGDAPTCMCIREKLRYPAGILPKYTR